MLICGIFYRKMKGVRDWFFSQLVSKSVVSSRPLSGSDSFFNEEPLDEDFDRQGIDINILFNSAMH